ncbi:MAG: hypothetical protein AAF708_21455 [Deinococcota bacterium]
MRTLVISLIISVAVGLTLCVAFFGYLGIIDIKASVGGLLIGYGSFITGAILGKFLIVLADQ